MSEPKGIGLSEILIVGALIVVTGGAIIPVFLVGVVIMVGLGTFMFFASDDKPSRSSRSNGAEGSSPLNNRRTQPSTPPASNFRNSYSSYAELHDEHPLGASYDSDWGVSFDDYCDTQETQD